MPVTLVVVEFYREDAKDAERPGGMARSRIYEYQRRFQTHSKDPPPIHTPHPQPPSKW